MLVLKRIVRLRHNLVNRDLDYTMPPAICLAIRMVRLLRHLKKVAKIFKKKSSSYPLIILYIFVAADQV